VCVFCFNQKIWSVNIQSFHGKALLISRIFKQKFLGFREEIFLVKFLMIVHNLNAGRRADVSVLTLNHINIQCWLSLSSLAGKLYKCLNIHRTNKKNLSSQTQWLDYSFRLWKKQSLVWTTYSHAEYRVIFWFFRIIGDCLNHQENGLKSTCLLFLNKFSFRVFWMYWT